MKPPIRIAMTVLLMVSLSAAACDVQVLNVAFGTYDGSLNDSQGNVEISNCAASPTNVTVKLDAGSHSLGTLVPRRLGSIGNDTLQYNLYRDSARSIVWGDDTQGTQSAAGAAPTTLIVYGRIFASQFVDEGLYQDTVLVTVQY